MDQDKYIELLRQWYKDYTKRRGHADQLSYEEAKEIMLAAEKYGSPVFVAADDIFMHGRID